jgi:hypothetical protein
MSTITQSTGILKKPPFYTVDGVANFREIGGYSSSEESDKQPSIIRLKHVFRSGELTYIKPSGAEMLKQLGIRKVFDLRADAEIKDYNAPPVDLGDVDISVERIGIPEVWPNAEDLGKQ